VAPANRGAGGEPSGIYIARSPALRTDAPVRDPIVYFEPGGRRSDRHYTWTGVSLQRLLPDLKLAASVTHLKIRSADHFFEVISLDAIKADPRIMLTYSWDGVPPKREHGYPLRIYIPDLYGIKQPKWIESIEATDHWEPGGPARLE